MNMNGLGHFEVLDFKLGATAGGPEQYVRTYAIHATEGNLNDLMRNTANGASVNANTLAKSSSLLGMSSDARSAISIDDGFEAPRSIAFLKVRSNATGDIYIITAYSTTDFMSSDGGINPRATLSFTSYSEFTARNMPDGSMGYSAPIADSLLTKQYISNSSTGHALYERPADMLSGAAVSGLSEDGTISVNQMYGNSTALNAQSTSWFGRSMLAMTDSSIRAGFDGDLSISGDGIASEASQSALVAENMSNRQPLLGSLITSITGASSMEITWSELLSRLPGLRNFLTNAPTAAGGNSAGLSFEAWNSRDAAWPFSELASAIPAMMLHLGISYVRFKITNEIGHGDLSQGNRPHFMLDTGDSIGSSGKPAIAFGVQGLDYERTIRAFEIYMATEIFPRVSNGHKVSMSVDASLVSHMIMAVEYDGYTSRFSSATFAHARWSAVTASFAGHNALTKGMAAVTNHLADTMNGVIGNSNSFGQSSNSGFGTDNAQGFGTNPTGSDFGTSKGFAFP
jgi:hypothetical protein